MTRLRPPFPFLPAPTDHAGATTWIRVLAGALGWSEDQYTVVTLSPDSSTCRLASLSTGGLALALARTPHNRLELHVRESAAHAATTGRNHVYAEAWLRSPHALAEHLRHRFQGPDHRAPLHTAA